MQVLLGNICHLPSLLHLPCSPFLPRVPRACLLCVQVGSQPPGPGSRRSLEGRGAQTTSLGSTRRARPGTPLAASWRVRA